MKDFKMRSLKRKCIDIIQPCTSTSYIPKTVIEIDCEGEILKMYLDTVL